MKIFFKKIVSFCILVLLFFSQLHSQENITLTFTCENPNNLPLNLNSILIENQTRLWQEILIYPDTVLYIGTTGVEEYSSTKKNIQLFQNTPNPFEGETNFLLVLQEKSDVLLEIYSLNGKLMASYKNTLPKGTHQFRAKLSAPQTYLLSARTEKDGMRIKMVNKGDAGQSSIIYKGGADLLKPQVKGASKGGTLLPFSAGDRMRYTGYASMAGVDYQNTIEKAQYGSEVITFDFNLPTISASTLNAIHITCTEVLILAEFKNNDVYPITSAGILIADNDQFSNADTITLSTIPFPGTYTNTFQRDIDVVCLQPASHYYYRAFANNCFGTVYGELREFTTNGTNDPSCPFTVTDYDGNTYNTVKIGNQCWMKENLRATHYADGTNISSYYDNSASGLELSKRGYLYDWVNVMRGGASSTSNPSGVQGVCPDGWHVPSDAEWSQLIYFVENTIEYVCEHSNTSGIARALASHNGWRNCNEDWHICAPGHTQNQNNATGFSVEPVGCSINNMYYYGSGEEAHFWSSTESSDSLIWSYELFYFDDDVSKHDVSNDFAFSVRCVRDEGGESTVLPILTTGMVSNVTDTSAVCTGNVVANGSTTAVSRGVCWSTSPSPTVSDGHLSNGSGLGDFTINITNLAPGFTYYVRAYATNSIGTSYGNEVSFTTMFSNGNDGQPCPGTATVTDYDGNVYNTVKIGSQCWMKENLRTTHYSNGNSIPSGNTYGNNAPYYYNSDFSNIPLAERGYLYNWSAVMHNASSSITNPSEVQGICPNGWHVPSKTEWKQLINYVGIQNQYLCNGIQTYIAKALASKNWWEPRPNTCQIGNEATTNNATGFSAVPRGDFGSMGAPSDGYMANFWTSTVYSGYGAWMVQLFYSSEDVRESHIDKSYGLSVRCVKDYSFIP